MPRPCSVCGHPARRDIDRALISGTSMRALARQHGVTDDSIRRHRDTHLRAALARAIEDERVDVDAEKLTGWAYALQAKTLVLLERADELDDLGNARGLIREARENLVLLGRLGGVLDGPTVHVDARQQLAVLGGLSDEDLRAIVDGARALPAIEAALPAGVPA